MIIHVKQDESSAQKEETHIPIPIPHIQKQEVMPPRDLSRAILLKGMT